MTYIKNLQLLAESFDDLAATFDKAAAVSHLSFLLENQFDAADGASICDNANLSTSKGASIFDNANLSASKGASIWDSSYLSAANAAGIMENANLSKAKCYDILSDANLSDSKFGDILDNSPEGPNVPKTSVTKVGEVILDSNGHDAVMGVYMNGSQRWQFYTKTWADGAINLLDFGVGPATKTVKKAAPDISYKFCVFTDPNGTVSGGWGIPGINPEGLAWDGAYLWAISNGADYVYKMNTDGSIASGWSGPTAGYGSGLAWDGTYLWFSDMANNYIYKLKTDGTTVTGWSTPVGLVGASWDGAYLWCPGSGYVYKLKTDGSVVGGWSAPATSPFGGAWDGTYLWINDTTAAYVYRLKTDGSVTGGWVPPDSSLSGLAWDGVYLWGSGPDSDYVYRLSGGTATYTKIADLVY